MSIGENSSNVKLAFASCSRDLIDQFVEEVRRMAGIDLPVFVVSEFQPTVACHWIPWQPFEDFDTNLGRIRWFLRDRSVMFSNVLLQPRQPYWDMRWAGVRLGLGRLYFWNENYGHFPASLRGLPQMARHTAWRARNLIRWQLNPGGTLYTYWWRLRNPFSWERPLWAWLAARRKPLAIRPLHSDTDSDTDIEPNSHPALALTPGITVVIPSRNGRTMLQTLLPGIAAQPEATEVIIVDNGSEDDTAALAGGRVRVIVKPEPLSFAAAVNLGIRAARTTHVCLLNNDMEVGPGFFAALRRAFDVVPDLFCATAQIHFPPGQRREETGKAVWKQPTPRDFPFRCDTPVAGEDLTPVLYGSGGCSLFDTAKLRALGCLKESFRPAYVEDLDLGWRGWQQGWASVLASGAEVVHHHRSTTAKVFSPSTIEIAIELNYLRWILSSVASREAFARLWKQAVWRLNLLAAIPEPAPIQVYALRFAAFHKPYFAWDRPAEPAMKELEILALGNGDLACFPGHGDASRPCLLIATSYLPFPLSHGGAVRMYNLIREAAKDYAIVLLSFVDEFAPLAPELAALCVEVIQVLREGSHYRRATESPKVVEEFRSESFQAAIHWAQRRWKPVLAQLEFTQMAQYAADCKPAKTLLIEHDITLDLYGQLLRDREEFDLRLEHRKWERFERKAWQDVDCVVVMSAKDAAMVTASKRVAVIENGVDLERFQPSTVAPETGRLLFIGSFAHLPNLMALAWFVREVWPRLTGVKLHIIGGRNTDYYLDFYRERVQVDLTQPGIELEGYVPDVRGAYSRAEAVIAPLLASAGTNIKVLEAMACGKAIIATNGGVNGLDLVDGDEFLLANDPEAFAAAVRRVFGDPEFRSGLERRARRAAEQRYGWEALGRKQRDLYTSLLEPLVPRA
jgi:glycosyltransferase involved in cell wall biosynthesis/GT2 family glycosyltransferase